MDGSLALLFLSPCHEHWEHSPNRGGSGSALAAPPTPWVAWESLMGLEEEGRTRVWKGSALGAPPSSASAPSAENHYGQMSHITSTSSLPVKNKEHSFSTYLQWVSPTARRSVVSGIQHLWRWVSLWYPFQNPNPRFCGFKRGDFILHAK